MATRGKSHTIGKLARTERILVRKMTLKIHRYDDNLYVQSPSSLISVFGRPLLPGGISGLGGINGDEDLEPLRVVAADGREWGVDFLGALIEEGEGLGAAGQRT